MVKLTKLTYAYGDKTVIKDLSFTFPARGIVALMGPSGCGKTTLLRLMAGLEKPCRGEVKGTHDRLSVAFQEPRLLPWMSAEENLKFVLLSEKQSCEIIDDLFEKFELSACRNDLPAALSGGMKQRLSLMRALAAGGDLLLLDEPFSALDDALKQRIAPFVKSANKQGLTVITTHDRRDAELLGAEIFYCSNSPLSALVKQSKDYDSRR